MVNPAYLFATLRELGIDFFTGVPDSLLKNMCAYLEDHCDEGQHIVAANEGSALALGIGYHLASGKLPLIYLQNSGIGNLVNPLLSLADPQVYSIPLILLIGWRGHADIADEPQHAKQGRITTSLLDTLELPYEIITERTEDPEAAKLISGLIATAQRENRPCALLATKNALSDYQLAKNTGSNYNLAREQAIDLVLAGLKTEDAVVSTTGFASRELFELRSSRNSGHRQDFLTVGGMGHANQIALGIALAQPERQVYCLDGDGAFIMHMGGSATCASSNAKNFKHIVLNNGVHDSVGGQPTTAGDINVEKIASALGYRWSASANSPEAVNSCLATLQNQPGPALLEIKIKPGTRTTLGRPSSSPAENKALFMEFLRQ
ncbi:MAG: phosphonopyruvate decarboxylase [Immundisolibacteraceae bacterium]|nr:phosphonopyruvate decarboxylase [Immundisolibacteraceae bacterium]